ncbi:site-specific integrase [Staphylococcus hominis]|uniref:site-specific integrase n=1 Tax=Staphylococcus hominis TaxID=1290 RepID=UPI0006B8FC43|nr:site-specific integrase [Staphylococcus hominis]KPG91673.1 integrase [Staphylococcus hominis]MCI2882950.1 site-specific integrase [Staphylococcus hominis]MCI2919523.1 site-specific integrase [Staphylococcus hominis]MDS3927689.1 site-specific integrase [Staphylococcus hominis]
MIKKYKKKDGSTAYMFVAYLGVDPITRKQKRTTRRGFKTEREAKIAEAKLQTEIQSKGFLNNDITTFKQVYELWIEQYKCTVRESTFVRVSNMFKIKILKEFDNMPIQSITTPYCQKVINYWIENYKDFRNIKVYAANVFEYAVMLKIIHENPFKYTKLPKRTRNKSNEYLTYYSSDELKQFLELIKDDLMYYAMFRLLGFTGMRRGELMALTWEDINFKNKTISIDKTVTIGLNSKEIIQPPKTHSSIRVISIDGRTLSILKNWRVEQRKLCLMHGHNTSNKSQCLFTNLRTNKRLQVQHPNKAMDKICKKYNFKKIKIHGFRHTHCSLLFEAGLSIQEVQDRLGHGDINTTMDVYAHITEKQREKVAEKFANYISF